MANKQESFAATLTEIGTLNSELTNNQPHIHELDQKDTLAHLEESITALSTRLWIHGAFIKTLQTPLGGV